MTVTSEPARVVVAGAASGVGKTTVIVALARALRARGLRVALFKCGPDYLDPTYHARAAAGPSYNLDGWLMGRDAVRATFADAARGHDVALVEGMMGLFDGASPASDEGSTAEVAKWLDAPVLLVADASGMARSIAALAAGYAAFDPALRVAGVIANRIGGRGHLDLLRRALARPPIVGGLPGDPALAFPERHLGLVRADERSVPEELLAAWGERASEWIDLDVVLRIARSAPALAVGSGTRTGASGAPASGRAAGAPRPRARIAVASDEALHFYYPDNLRRLEAAGAELVPFSPLRDRALPDTDGVLLGGGYPEAHAEALAANERLRRAIAEHAAAGGPIYAECGGLMLLARRLRTLDGREHEMVGVLPCDVAMRDRLQAIGYVEVETRRRTILGPPGLRFRGHQFRHSELVGEAVAEPAYLVREPRGDARCVEGFALGSVVASYVHAHWASNPRIPEELVSACAARRARTGAAR
ncbi:MAG TPA: cobyrinate a,c-diamide synthase [Candidatus Binatia bacterium]|nr:cobyrinate a,c-diamide synthase [Candidatus Binatia bacterium]